MKILSILAASMLAASAAAALPVRTSSAGHYVLTNSDGLSNSSVTCISQDSLGRIWAGTWDGLNVYDSHQFWIWQYEPADTNSISNSIIRDVVEQGEGIIWVATDYGINRIDTHRTKVDRFYLGYKSRTPSEEKTFSISASPSGKIFCAAKDWGLAIFNEETFLMDAVNIPEFNTSEISGIYCLDDSRLMLRSGNDRISLITYSFQENGQIDITDKQDLFPDKDIISVFNCRHCLYILSSDNTLFRMDKKTAAIKGSSHIPVNDNVRAVTEIKADSLAIGFENRGVCMMNMSSGAVSWSEELSNMNILSLYYGTQDILWIGTDGQGLWTFYEDPFKMNRMTYSQMSDSRTHYPVRAFYKNSSGDLYTGTKGNGIFVIRDGRTLKSYGTELGNSSIFALEGTPDGNILVGHDGKGIDIISGKDGTVSHVVPDAGRTFGSVYSFLTDTTDRCIWMGTFGYGLVRMELEESRDGYRISDIEFYDGDENNPDAISNNMVQPLLLDNDRILWIGTRGGGLNRMDLRTGKISHYTTSSGDAPISSNEILSLHISRDSTLWIGTSYGLNRLISYEDGTCRFEAITTKDGLHNNTIHGIEEDGSGNLWLSTNYGLSVYTPGTGEIINYYNDRKLQNNEFSDGAHYMDQDGIIYFGGIDGFNWFDPSGIQARDYSPEILISRVTLSQNPDTDLLGNAGSVTLKYNENFFNVHFTALEYINNSNCEYAYRLDGFNSDWVYIGTEHTASFTNVPPGRYTFYIKCTNGDKAWGDRITSLAIRVTPPWWATVWAYMAYILLAVCIAYFTQKAINARIRQKHRLELEALKRKQLFDTYEAKLRFFTNIAHEFTTPLTLICGPIEQIMNEYKLPAKVEKYNRIILSNAERMLRLIQELIEFRKADTGNQKPHYSRVDLTEMAMTILDNFSEMKEEKQISVETSIGQGMSVVTDHNAMEKILYNLISNAFKYTPDGGTIEVHVEAGGNGVDMYVKNTGKGIKPEHLDQVFDRFVILDDYEYRAKKGKTLRNGIGMALVHSLVKMLSGKITVSSEQGKYTMFTVTLPYVGDEMVTNAPVPEIQSSIEHKETVMPETEEDRASAASGQQGRKSIMVVDDEAEIRNLVSDILGHEYRIIQAKDGKDAVEKLKDGIPDLIISDLNMPNMNGTELLRYLKSNDLTKFIPVIFLAFKTDIGDEIETYEMGSEVFIPKPFYPKHLKAVVHRIMDNRSMLKDYYNSAISSTDMYEGEAVDTEDRKFLVQMTSIIEENISNEGLSPNLICEKMAISRMQLYRKLKELTKQTPSEFIRNIKLEHAAHLLKTTRLTVQEVMFSSGFNNKSYFYREFAEKYRMSPKEFRKEGQ